MSQNFPDILPQNIKGILNRIVESKELQGTQELVDTLDEQSVLETLIESSKPIIPIKMKDYHYLLYTPFRYPPLKHGSRFGTANEPSLFYGSLNELTCMCECAFYRLTLFHCMEEKFPQPIRTQHTLFTVPFYSNSGLDLSSSSFSEYQDKLCHISDFTFTQEFGHLLRTKGIDCFLYTSARDSNNGLNIALFNPTPFQSYQPTSMSEWYSQVNSDIVQFQNIRLNTIYTFNINQFLDTNGRLPSLAP
ncbi:RES family NAD+ phosphorylase [Thiotrichales bacterium 19X7-9]|nr:RES family NAD+ phosphorylase [Thiotrichales bacterium 19X7-9]